jgi:hypothetical protein
MMVSKSKWSSALDRLIEIPAVNMARTINAITVEVNLIRYISTLSSGKYFISKTIANKPKTAASNAMILRGTINRTSSCSLTAWYVLLESGNLPVRIKSSTDKLKDDELLLFLFTISNSNSSSQNLV